MSPRSNWTRWCKLLFPEQAPIYALRVNGFEMVTFPGEPTCELGLAVKDALRQAGIAHPCVAALTTDQIGYILTKAEYQKSGYEVTASFYGDGLGQLLLEHAKTLGRITAAAEIGLASEQLLPGSTWRKLRANTTGRRNGSVKENPEGRSGRPADTGRPALGD